MLKVTESNKKERNMTYRSLQALHISVNISGLNGIRHLQNLQKRNMKQLSVKKHENLILCQERCKTYTSMTAGDNHPDPISYSKRKK